MDNQWAFIVAAFVLVMGFGLAGVIFAIERCRNKKTKTDFNADSARELSKQWYKGDTAQMSRIERKIKQCCRRGECKLVLPMTPRPMVAELLKNRGFEVVMGHPIGAIIKW